MTFTIQNQPNISLVRDEQEVKVEKAGYLRGHFICKKYQADEAQKIRELFREYAQIKTNSARSFDKNFIATAFTVGCWLTMPSLLIPAVIINVYTGQELIHKSMDIADKMEELDRLRDEHITSNGNDIVQATAKAAYEIIKKDGDIPAKYAIPYL